MHDWHNDLRMETIPPSQPEQRKPDKPLWYARYIIASVGGLLTVVLVLLFWRVLLCILVLALLGSALDLSTVIRTAVRRIR